MSGPSYTFLLEQNAHLSSQMKGAHEELAKLTAALAESQAKLAEKQKIIESSCKEWADDHDVIEKIAAQFGIKPYDEPDYFKNNAQLYEELAAKLTAAQAECAAKDGENAELKEGFGAIQKLHKHALSQWEKAIAQRDRALAVAKELGDALAEATKQARTLDYRAPEHSKLDCDIETFCDWLFAKHESALAKLSALTSTEGQKPSGATS